MEHARERRQEEPAATVGVPDELIRGKNLNE